jgi:ferredoxin-NADP reductase
MRVVDVHRESDTITSFVLRPLDERAPTPRSEAGQYLTLRLLPEGEGGPLVIRSYSMSSVAGEDGYRISVRLVRDGAGSGYLHQHIHQGDVVAVAAPRGDFVLRDGQRPIVLLSAGVGATPVLAMLQSLAARRDRREVWWVHGARDRFEHAFGSEVDQLLGALPQSHRLISYSDPDEDELLSPDFDDVGHISGMKLREAGVLLPMRAGRIHENPLLRDRGPRHPTPADRHGALRRTLDRAAARNDARTSPASTKP